MQYAIIEIWCHKLIFSDRLVTGCEVMCTVPSKEQAEDEKKLFEARDSRHYVICQVQE